MDWITRHMEQEGLKIIKTKSFNILHTVESASRQIRVAQTKLNLMSSSALKAGMTTYLEELGQRLRVAVANSDGKIPLSFDYIIAAELPTAQDTNLGSTILSILTSPFVNQQQQQTATTTATADDISNSNVFQEQEQTHTHYH